MKRTLTAVTNRAKRLKLHSTHDHQSVLHANDVARAMGIPSAKTVAYWIECDLLKATKRVRNRTKAILWRIQYEDLVKFVNDPTTWMLWRVEDIQDDHLLWHIERCRNKSTWRWLSTPEAAEQIGMSKSFVRKRIMDETVPAIVRGGSYWIDSRDLHLLKGRG